jgi:hypothetical protein
MGQDYDATARDGRHYQLSMETATGVKIPLGSAIFHLEKLPEVPISSYPEMSTKRKDQRKEERPRSRPRGPMCCQVPESKKWISWGVWVERIALDRAVIMSSSVMMADSQKRITLCKPSRDGKVKPVGKLCIAENAVGES